jgi:hypothetical protein
MRLHWLLSCHFDAWRLPCRLAVELLMAGIAQNIERYNLAYELAWKHISERQKGDYPNIATFLHDAIRRQLNEGATEPVFIAAEALKYIEKITSQTHSEKNEEH